MNSIPDPTAYEAWYTTPRGQWVSDCEFTLLMQLLKPDAGASLLDVGCGTGHFSRRFARSGLSVTGIDPDPAALAFARARGEGIHYRQGSALELPFPDKAFDYTVAVTSLCFVEEPLQALQEIWRVSRHASVLGLLNRHSLLHRRKKGRGSYTGARWDAASEVLDTWLPALTPLPGNSTVRTAIFFPGGSRLAQWSERLLPNVLPWGGFLAVALEKP